MNGALESMKFSLGGMMEIRHKGKKTIIVEDHDEDVTVTISRENYSKLMKLVGDKQAGVNEIEHSNRKPREVTLDEILHDLTWGRY